MKPFQTLTQRGRARRLRQLALHALELYDLDVARLCLVTNDMNGIFRVETHLGEKWILRVTLPEGGHTRDHVTAEMDWLSALARDTDLSVPHPLPARDGGLLVEAGAVGVPEPRLCEIFSWVPGTDLANRLTPANMARLGTLSARLHEHARNFILQRECEILHFDRVFPFPEPVVLFEARFEGLFTPIQRRLFQQAVDWAQAAIDHLKASGEPMRLIHGDLHQWNVRIAHGVLSPIDFEDLMWGWPVQDIATTLYYSQDEPDYAQLRAAFERGYRRVSPWPERSSGEIDAFIAARALGMLNFVLQNHELLEMDPIEFGLRTENRLRALIETESKPG